LLVWTTALVAAEPTFHGKTFAEWKAQLGKGKPEDRGRAAMALGLGPFGKKAVDPLLPLLNEQDQHVRHCAIVALGCLGRDAETAILSLEIQLHKEEKSDVAAICETLGKIGPASVPVLFSVYEPSVNRTPVEDALIHHCRKDALPELEKAILDNARCYLAVKVLYFFGEDAAPALPTLVRALKEKRLSRTYVQDESQRILIHLGPKAEPAIPVLALALKGSRKESPPEGQHPTVFLRPDLAAELLVAIGKPAWPTMRNILDNYPDDSAGVHALLKCLKPDWDGALPRLLTRLKDRDAELRAAAAQSLKRFSLDLGPHLPLLRKALKDENPGFRVDVYDAISGIETISDEAAHVLALGILDSSEDVRRRVEHRLDEKQSLPASACAALLTALRDQREDVRERALRLIGQADRASPAILNALCDALANKDEPIRSAAARAIGALGQQTRRVPLVNDVTVVDRVVPALQALMRDRDQRVRASAASALCCVGNPIDAGIREIALGIASSPDRDRFLRLDPRREREAERILECRPWISALTLCKDRAGPAVPILIKGLEHPVDWVRRDSADVLGSLKLGAKTAIPALEKVLKDPYYFYCATLI
jgi:HEAT repeat protein